MNIKNNKIKISLITSLLLAVIVALCLMLSNTANAEEENGADNDPLPFYDVYLVGLSGEFPTLDTDFKREVIDGVDTLTILTPGWILTGTANNEDYPVNLLIKTTKLYLKDLDIHNAAFQIMFSAANECEIELLRCEGMQYSTLPGLSADNIDLRFTGEGLLYFGGGSLFSRSLTLDKVTLGFYKTEASNAVASFAVNVKGDLTMKSSRLIAENWGPGEAYAAGFFGQVTIDDSSELYLVGSMTPNNYGSVAYDIPGTLDNVLGSEEVLPWLESDKSKINKKTEEVWAASKFTKVIEGTNIPAKTIFKPAVNPPAPEPVNPEEYTAAQTGDDNAVIVLVIALIAVAAAATCIYLYKRKK